MALYRVMIPFSDSSSAQARYTTIEIEAGSELLAKRLALAEFGELSAIGQGGSGAKVHERDIKVERAPVARRGSFETFVTILAPGVATARLVGSIGSSNYTTFQDMLDKVKAENVKRLVLDLSGLTYINSTGLSLFVAAGDMFDIRLAAVPVKIMHILKMIGLDQLFPSYGGVSEAAKAPPAQ